MLSEHEPVPAQSKADRRHDRIGCSTRDDVGVTPEEFVARIKSEAFDPAVAGLTKVLRVGAPGRNPGPRLQALSLWYSGLSNEDQRLVSEVTRDAAHAAIFHLLAILDEVALPSVHLVLTATESDGSTTVLASGDTLTELHDLFNGQVHPPSEPWP